MRRVMVLCWLSLGGAGCFFPAERGRVLEGRVDALTDEAVQLRSALRETQAKLDRTTERLQETLNQLDSASRTAGANIGVRVDSAIQDSAMLRGQMEALQHRLQELEQHQSDHSGAPAGGEAKEKELKRPDDPKEFLKLADDKAKEGDIELSRKLYNEFLKKWPKDENAGEAHFGLGDSYFGEKRCRESLYEYGKVIQDFPKSHSAPTAYLKSADCFRELKMLAEAKLALEEVLRQHPKSDAAKVAKQRLADLAKPLPKPKK